MINKKVHLDQNSLRKINRKKNKNKNITLKKINKLISDQSIKYTTIIINVVGARFQANARRQQAEQTRRLYMSSARAYLHHTYLNTYTL